MKRIIPFILFIALIFTSCEYEADRPYADFTVNYDLVVPNEVIKFRNYSEDANYYEWNFGDGTITTELNPYHVYEEEGVYTVTLAAFRGSRVDYAYMEIEVFYTSLEVQVIDYATDQPVRDMNIILYPDELAYLDFGPYNYKGYTDYNGIVIFERMNSGESFFVEAYNQYYDNYTFYTEDPQNIATLPLEHAMHNVFVAWVDYKPGLLKSASDEPQQMRVRKVEAKTEKRDVVKKQYATRRK